MLVCLEERGYIAQSPDSDRYHLTLYLFRLAQEHPPIKRMTMQALPIMQQVAHDISQSCHLGVLNGGQVVIIAQVDSPVSPGFYVKAGAVVDLMRAATGHVILAHQTQEARARAIRSARERWVGRAILSASVTRSTPPGPTKSRQPGRTAGSRS